MQDDKLFGPAELPELPPNARYVVHENRCYDWGTIGWALQEGKVDTAQYRYIIFMNSSVRGPFLPGYYPVSLWLAWQAAAACVVQKGAAAPA